MECNHCGKPIKEGASFCSHCGKPVGSSNKKPINNAIKKPNKSIFITAGLVITVIIMAVIIKSGVISSYLENRDIQKTEKENREIVDEALAKASEKTNVLSVTISGGSSADSAYDGYKMESTMNDNAIVEFKNNEVHMSDGHTSFKARPKVFDGTEHSEGNKFEVYISNTGKVIRSINGSEFNNIDAEPLEIQECLWFFEDIKKNLENVDIKQNDDELIVKGTLDNGKEICNTYIKFIELAGDEPEKQVTDHVSYELRILRTTKEVKYINFDVSDIAEYVWYGSNDDGLSISNVYGDLRFTYHSFKKTEDFGVPVLKVEESVQEEDYDNSLTETPLPAWKQAYIDYLSSGEGKYTDKDGTISGFSLIYIDEDNIPEIIHDMGYMADGFLLLTYSNNEVHEEYLSRGGFAYLEKKNLFYNSFGRMGSYGDSILRLNNGVSEEIAGGHYEDKYNDNGNIAQDADGNYLSEYYWGDAAVSEEEYQAQLEKLFDKSTAKSNYDLDTYTRNQIIQQIIDWNDNTSTKQASAKDTSQDSDYILPDCDSRYYSQKELSALSEEQLKLARNEIYARHGYIFQKGDTKNYFDSKSWYRGTVSEVTDDMLNEYEIANRDLIISIENK